MLDTLLVGRMTTEEGVMSGVKRWSATRKQEVVLRLLRGESLDAVSRETGVPAGNLSSWRDECGV